MTAQANQHSPAARQGRPVWEDRAWPPLPTLRSEERADVCVVGLGASGLSAVTALRDRGVDVVGLDAGVIGGGAAGRNGGFLLAGTADFHHRAATMLGADRAAALYRLTLGELDRVWLETPQAFRRSGSLRLATTAAEQADCRTQLAVMRAASLPARPYTGPEGSGLLFPLDGASQPLRRCRLLTTRARLRQARLYERSPAVHVRGDRVRAPAGQVRCGAVVVAVDGGLEAVLPELQGRVRTARAQMLATAPAPEVAIPRPVYARWGYDYWRQLPDRRVVLGGFRDLGGEDEWTADARPSPAVQAALETFLRQGLGVRAPVTHRWAGTIAFTPDRLPVAEQVRERVWVAGAYSGTGNLLGPLCARAAASHAVGTDSPLDGLLPGLPGGPRRAASSGGDARPVGP